MIANYIYFTWVFSIEVKGRYYSITFDMIIMNYNYYVAFDPIRWQLRGVTDRLIPFILLGAYSQMTEHPRKNSVHHYGR